MLPHIQFTGGVVQRVFFSLPALFLGLGGEKKIIMGLFSQKLETDLDFSVSLFSSAKASL